MVDKEEVRRLAQEGKWSAAINMALESNLTIEEIAKGLEVTQSTVGRWVRDETGPVRGLIPHFTELLMELFW